MKMIANPLLAFLCIAVSAKSVGAQVGPVFLSGGPGSEPSGLSVAGSVLAMTRWSPTPQESAFALEKLADYPFPTWGNPVDLSTLAPLGSGFLLGGAPRGSCATDGTRIVVGVPSNDDLALNSGAAFVFLRIGGAWQFEQKLLPAASLIELHFGTEVAIDRRRLVVSARWDGGSSFLQAYSFDGAAWVFESIISRPGKVALSGDRLLIGSPVVGAPTGIAWIYERQGAGWYETAAIQPTDLVAGDRFGEGIALDGDTAAIGARRSGAGAPSGGTAYVFHRNGGSWVQEVKLTPSGLASNASFGEALALRDGVLAIGASGQGPGTLYLFQRGGPYPFSTFAPVGVLAVSQSSVAGRHVSYDGQTLAASAFGGVQAFAYQYPSTPTSYCAAKVNSAGCVPRVFAAGSLSVSGPDDLHLIAENVLPSAPGMLVWSRSPASVPFGGGTLCVAAPVVRTPIQAASPGPAGTCGGRYDFHLSHATEVALGLGAGASFFAQYYSRDNGFPAPGNVGLTDAVHLVLRP